MRNIKKIMLILAILSVFISGNIFVKPNIIPKTVGDDWRITVTTDKEVYVHDEVVNITITNTGSAGISAVPELKIYYVALDGIYSIVHDPLTEKLVFNLAPGESFTYAWDQKNDDGVQVPKGEYWIRFYYWKCCGIIASDATTIYIQGPIYIEDIKGGFGLSVVIKNIGEEDVYNVNCSIEISGLVIFGANNEKIIDVVPAKEKITIHIILYGVGPATIKIMASKEEKTVNCFLLGPLVLVVN